MSAHGHSGDLIHAIEEPSTPSSTESAVDTDEITRSARRLKLASNMRANIVSTKSGFAPRSVLRDARFDYLETVFTACRSKVLKMELMVNKYC